MTRYRHRHRQVTLAARRLIGRLDTTVAKESTSQEWQQIYQVELEELRRLTATEYPASKARGRGGVGPPAA